MRLLSRFEDESFLKRLGRYGAYTILVALVLIAFAGFFNAARAADKGGSGKIAAPESSLANLLPSANVGPNAPWTGLWLGAHGGYIFAEGSVGEFTASNDGMLIIPAAGFDIQYGKVVLGGEVSYGWFFGGLHDAGDRNVLSFLGRIGFLPTNNTLVYVHGAKSRLYGTDQTVDGWQFGPGVELKTNGGFSIDFRYAYGIWDNPDWDDVTSHVFTVGLKYRF